MHSRHSRAKNSGFIDYGIILNYSSDFSGDVRVAWYAGEDYTDEMRKLDRVPETVHSVWVEGALLRRGYFRVKSGAQPPPVEVQLRAVALALDTWWSHKAIAAIEHIGIES